MRVNLHNSWDKAVIIGLPPSPRSYFVTTEDGSTYRKNQQVLNPSPKQTHILPHHGDELESNQYNGSHTDQSGKPPDNPVLRVKLTPMPSTSHMLVRESFNNQHSPVAPITRKCSRHHAKPVWQKNYKTDFLKYYMRWVF